MLDPVEGADAVFDELIPVAFFEWFGDGDSLGLVEGEVFRFTHDADDIALGEANHELFPEDRVSEFFEAFLEVGILLKLLSDTIFTRCGINLDFVSHAGELGGFENFMFDGFKTSVADLAGFCLVHVCRVAGEAYHLNKGGEFFFGKAEMKRHDEQKETPKFF